MLCCLPGALPKSTPVVVDIGAGYGMFTLSAAARGLRVVAFEASEKSAAALEASIDFNNVASKVQLHKVALGETAEATVKAALPEGGWLLAACGALDALVADETP